MRTFFLSFLLCTVVSQPLAVANRKGHVKLRVTAFPKTAKIPARAIPRMTLTRAANFGALYRAQITTKNGAANALIQSVAHGHAPISKKLTFATPTKLYFGSYGIAEFPLLAGDNVQPISLGFTMAGTADVAGNKSLDSLRTRYLTEDAVSEISILAGDRAFAAWESSLDWRSAASDGELLGHEPRILETGNGLYLVEFTPKRSVVEKLRQSRPR